MSSWVPSMLAGREKPLDSRPEIASIPGQPNEASIRVGGFRGLGGLGV